MRRLFIASFLPLLCLGCDFTARREAPAPVRQEGSEGPEEGAPIREAGEGGDPVVILGLVLEAPRPPPCGRSTYRVAIRYEVIRVVEGALEEPEILVRQECPEAERPQGDAGPIVVGDEHLLTLDPEPYRTVRRVQWIPRRTDRADDV